MGFSAVSDNTTIFGVSLERPQDEIACAVDAIETHLSAYHKHSRDNQRTLLLDEIERLRRFVLVRASLARGLAKAGGRDARMVGRQLCDALHAMIGDVPAFVATHSAPNAPVMERDTFRVIACLNFLGSLNPAFL